MTPGSALSHTEREIGSQPEVWRETLAGLDRRSLTHGLDDDPADVLVTGCGSTHYLALTIAALVRSTGRRARALPASELLPDAEPALPGARRAALMAFSRSGTTTETLLAVDSFRRLGGRTVIAFTCDPGSPLAAAADVVHDASAAAERSVAQTRSFSTMLLLGQAVVGALAGDDVGVLSQLPARAGRLLEASRPLMATIAGNRAREAFYFLASDPLFGVACEGMLKLKEMSLTSSEAYHALEFRHGPMSMCDDRAVVVGLLSPERVTREQAVIDDVRPLVGEVVTAGPGGALVVPPDLPPWARPVLYLLPLQLLALERALAKGLDPDAPRHLTAVIHLNP